jgi:hypothetical protein
MMKCGLRDRPIREVLSLASQILGLGGEYRREGYGFTY